MAQIIPAILEKDFSAIRAKLAQLEDLSPWAELDVLNGTLTAATGWYTPDDLGNLAGKIKIETHLMVSEPELVLREWLAVADRIVVHYEATDQLAAIFDMARGVGAEIGLALDLQTPVSVVAPYVGVCRYFQLLAITNLGESGEAFEPTVLDKLKSLRKECPAATIAVDGGIKAEQIKALVAAGADILVVNSALWGAPDLAVAWAELNKLAV